MRLPELTQIEPWIAAREAAIIGLRQGCEKRIIWAGDAGARTPVSVVYIHGFSASPEELRPLPDLIAKALGANLHFGRLTGHGIDGAALAATTADEWLADAQEAIDVGRALGEKVIVISCSTGSTVAVQALADDASHIKASVFVSPNFAMAHPMVQMFLMAPGVRKWGTLVAGQERAFRDHSDAHRRYWTTRYPTTAVFVMADAMRRTAKIRTQDLTMPAFFATCAKDQVVSAKRTAKTAKRWGGTVHEHELVMGPDDDQMGHLIAGDVFSAAQTEPLASEILDWLAHI